jgi:hypothetical protein
LESNLKKLINLEVKLEKPQHFGTIKNSKFDFFKLIISLMQMFSYRYEFLVIRLVGSYLM